MKKHGKRYENALKKVAVEQPAAPTVALQAVKDSATAKFNETVEAAIRLGVDPRQGDQMVRGSVNLPHGTGKSPKVAVFARGENAAAAEEAGADVVGAEDLVARIDEGWRDFDILVATRDMMGIVGKLGRKLGPRMPNPKAGTVTDNIAQTVRDLKGGKAAFRVDKAGQYPRAHRQSLLHRRATGREPAHAGSGTAPRQAGFLQRRLFQEDQRLFDHGSGLPRRSFTRAGTGDREINEE